VRVIDRRVGWLFLIFLAALALALVRSLWLGGVESGKLKREAFAQQVTTQPVPAERGAITDTSGTPLALSESVDDVDADPYLINEAGDANAMAAKIAPLLHLPTVQVLTALTKPKTGYSPIATKVAPSVARKILDLTIDGKPINGIYTELDTKRVYPRSWELSQVLGFVDHTGNGASGLEAEYNTDLAGTSGERKVVNNPNTGDPISVQDTTPVRNGKSLQLTISAPLQSEVEQVLAGVGAQYSPKMATAIVMNPRNGAILALGNWPRVNDNDPYSTGASTAEINNAIQDHAVSFTYEPGSTFKAITVAGALQDGLITPSTEFDVPPDLTAYGSVIHDAENHGYEELSTAGILKVSSNIGADLIGQKLGADRFNYWVHRFGLGRSTGSHLPGENAGYILSPKDYSGTSMYNLPFGQGESVTPLQMADVYSAIANGGILRAPHLVKAIGGTAQPTPKGHRVISTTTAAELRNMLRGVLGEGGTASGAAIEGYDLAGKTGTANVAVDGKYSDSEYVASFIGMVPASAPKLVVAVVVDEPQNGIYGGSVAGPAFQKIVGWAVPYLGINPNPAGIKTNP
jgi:cell division protein FtsI (penicillin-binding protein 3)